jgi:hypothetical protein
VSEDDGGPDVDPLVAVAARITEQIRHEMGDTWRRDDQLLKKFFPINLTSYSKFKKGRKKLYNDNRNQKRWKNIPSKPQSAPHLCTPLRILMNNVLQYHGITRKTRLFLDTHTRKKIVCSIPPSPISPSLFLAGVGDEFANTYAEQPQAFTQSGISPVEIFLDSEDLVDARDRLAVNMQQMFQNQDNRRFAYSLVLTETMITVYVGSCRAIGQLRIKAQRLEAESRPSHGRSYWKRTEEKGKEWKGMERKESSHMILLYIIKKRKVEEEEKQQSFV